VILDTTTAALFIGVIVVVVIGMVIEVLWRSRKKQ
jgi:heme/copper-type cytochrome/quinol oxidase subunit 2